MIVAEESAGGGQTIVAYMSLDTGDEVDPAWLVQEIAEDAARRAEAGERIVAMTGLPLRHAAVAFGREGSGYQTKAAVLVTYRAG